MAQIRVSADPPRTYLSARPAMRGRYLIRNRWVGSAMWLIDAVSYAAFRLGRAPKPIASPYRILVSNWAHLGDVLMAFGATEWVRKTYPDAEIGFLCGSWSKSVVDTAVPHFDHVHVADHFMLSRSGTMLQRLVRHGRSMASATKQIRAVGYDIAIDLYPFFPSAAVLLWRAGIPNRVGWTSGGLSGFLTERVGFSAGGRHIRDTNIDLLSRLSSGGQMPSALATISPPSVLREKLPAQLNDGKPYVAVHMGAGKRNKEWLDEHWVKVVGGLLQTHRVVLLGSGKIEVDRAAEVAKAFPSTINLAGQLSWATFEAVISGADLLVGLDSVGGHLAARYGVPSVTIMGGMTDPRQWSPASPYSAVVSHPTPCAPCNRNGCAHMHCIRGVLPTDVLAAAQSAMAAKATSGDTSPRAVVPQDLLSVSIVVINHNYGRFLETALDSAIAQQGDNIQIIVVDDGSTDNSREIIKRYGDQITPIFQALGGHVRAVNSGFAASSGKLVIFLDADDQLYPHCVAEARAAWLPGLVKVQFQLDTVDSAGRDQDMQFPHFPPSLTSAETLRQSLRFGVYPWTVSSGNIYSRDYLNKILPIDAEVIYKSPDGYMNKMAPLFGNVLSIRKALGAYRVHGSNAWAQTRDNLRLGPIQRWLHFDTVLHREFLMIAAKRGYAGPEYDKVRSTQQLEHRLLSFRLSPNEHPIEGDSKSKLMLLSLQGAFQSPNSGPLGKVLWAFWLFFLATAPSRIVATAFVRYRAQIGREQIARRLLNIERGKRPVGRKV